MNKIIPGLYLGSLDDSRDKNQLKKFLITHIVSVIESPKQHFPVIKNFITIKILIYFSRLIKNILLGYKVFMY